MHHVTVTTAAGANSNRPAPSTSANMVEGVPAGEPPPHPRIMTSSPGGVLVSSGGTAMTTHESTVTTTAHLTNARAATLSALGSSVGSSGGGMSDSGFAASISSGYDSRTEVPIAKFWASETAQEDLEDDFEDDDLDALEYGMSNENEDDFEEME